MNFTVFLKYVLVTIVWLMLRVRRLFRGRKTINVQNARCLIVSLSGIGNTIMCTPLLQTLKENGASVVDALVPGAAHSSILSGIEACDQIFRFSGRRGQKWNMLKTLRSQKYDALFFAFPTPEITYALFPLVIKPRFAAIHNMDMFHPFFKFLKNMFDVVASIEQDWHDIEQNLSLLHNANVKIKRVDHYPEFVLPDSAHEKANDYLLQHELNDTRNLCFMHPGSTRGTDFKRWPTEKFVELGDILHEKYDMNIVVIIGPDEAEFRDYFQRPGFSIVQSVSFDVTLALLRKARMLVSNDSGLMHAAALLRVPTVTMWGGTDKDRTGPRGVFSINIENDRLPCQPCSRFVSHVNCPDVKYECMKSITVSQVYEAMKNSPLLDKN